MTPSQTLGPFYHFALTTDASLGCAARPECEGERIRLRIRLLDADGAPVQDGMIELWQPEILGFGRLATDADGACTFETIRTAFVNVIVFARGLLNHLYTRIYFEPGEDPILALVPDDRRSTLLARCEPDCWTFDIRLQGENETVFFDL